MADFEAKEKYTGVYKPTGEEIQFNKSWGAYEFNDEECEKLLNGEEIQFETTSRGGNDFTAKGGLSQLTYNDHDYWSFEPDFAKKKRLEEENK